MLNRSACWQLNYLCCLSNDLTYLVVRWSDIVCVCHFTGHLSNPLLDSFAWPGLLTLALYALYWRLHSLKSWWQSAHDKTSIISFEGCKHPSTLSSSSWPPIASSWTAAGCLIVIVCGNLTSTFCLCLSFRVSARVWLIFLPLFAQLSSKQLPPPTLPPSLCPHHVFSGCIHMSLFAGKTLVVRARIRLQSF